MGIVYPTITNPPMDQNVRVKLDKLKLQATGRKSAKARISVEVLPGFPITCSNLVPLQELNYCNFNGQDLSNVNLTGSSLVDAELASNLTDTNLTDTTLTGVSSGGIVGTPIGLPAGWRLVGGYLLGLDANLRYATLAGFDLSGAILTGTDLMQSDLSQSDLTGADLTNADLDMAVLTGATLTGVTWANTTCPDGTNSDNDGGTCVDNLTP
jgi:uncharacterized protein YjbI with pentapeptide repeats